MSKTIKELEKELSDFLEKHPELKPFQENIEKGLNKLSDPKDRLNVIYGMMVESHFELTNKMKDLQTLLEDVKNKNVKH